MDEQNSKILKILQSVANRNVVELKKYFETFDGVPGRAVIEILKNAPGSKKPSGALWLTYFQVDMEINHKLFEQMERKEFVNSLDKQWFKVELMIDRVTTEIEKNKSLLEDIINKRTNV